LGLGKLKGSIDARQPIPYIPSCTALAGAVVVLAFPGDGALEISVTGRHLELTDSMRQFVQDKVSKLERFFDRIESVQVIADRESTRFRTEIVLRTDHKHTLVAQTEADDFRESVDLVIDKMERQLREHKEKLRNRKHQPGATNKPGS
jgi:putative sigma-54 modulation protein